MQPIFAATFAIIFIMTFKPSLAQAYDCSGVVVQEGEAGQLNYLANVSFTVPKAIEGDWVVEMQTDVPFTFLGGWGVWVKSDPDDGKAQFRSRLENNTLAEGDQVSFRFRISWFRGEEQLTVTSMTWEGIQLCKETEGIKPIVASRRRRTDSKQPSRRVNYRKRYFINL